MPNDPLPSLDLFPAPPKEAADEIVHPQINEADGGRDKLTEFASRERTFEARQLVGSIARLEAAMRDEPSPLAAAVARGLADFAARIKEIESILAACDRSAPEVYFAVERMQDIARSLRGREVEPALSDTLEAAIREVGDAILRYDAAAAHATSAAALLRELGDRVDGMIAHLGVESPVPEPRGPEQIDSHGTQPLNDLARPSPGDAAYRRNSFGLFDDAHSEPAGTAQVAVPLPDNEAGAGSPESQGVHGDAMLRSVAEGTECPAAHIVSDASSAGASPESASQAAASARQPRIDQNSTHENPPAADYEPLAAFTRLSEEELIALFS